MKRAVAKVSDIALQGCFTMRVERRSMEPTLMPGDSLEVEQCQMAALRAGDLVVYERQGSWVVHRLLALGRNWLLTRGDAQRAVDAPVASSALRGRVVRVQRHAHTWSTHRRFSDRLQAFVRTARSHWSGDPFRWRWLTQGLVSLNFAGVPIQILIPDESRQRLPSVVVYEKDWRSVGDFNSWTIEFNPLARRTDWLKPRDAEYQLDIRSTTEHLEILAQHFFANVDRRRKYGLLSVDTIDQQGSLENCLRVLLARLLPERQGMLVHAAALTDGKVAWLCIGKSGSGKSTLAALGKQAGLRIISDDLVCVRKRDGEWIVDGLPFKGAHPQASFSAGQFPLRAVLTLEKAASEELRALEAPQAVGAILASLPFIQQDAVVLESAMNLIAQLVQEVPVHRLSFRPLSNVWNFVLRRLGY